MASMRGKIVSETEKAGETLTQTDNTMTDSETDILQRHNSSHLTQALCLLMPPTSKGRQSWKRANDDGSSRDDQGVSSPSARKQARTTADVDGSSITPVAGRRSQVSSCFPTSMASTSKQHRAWKSADADDGSSIVLSAREAAIMPSTSDNKRGTPSQSCERLPGA